MGRYRNIVFCLLIVFSSETLFAQENCFNGIDDDGDGFIDLNDDQCSCVIITPLNIFEDFEAMVCCPISASNNLGGGIFCLENEIGYVNGTSDYFHTCGYMGHANLPVIPQPFPSGDGAVGGINRPGYGEYVGICLDDPMIVNNVYDFSIQLGMNEAVGEYSLVNPIDFVLYGNVSCDEIRTETNFIGINGECIEDTPGWELLATVTVNANVGGWTLVSGSFAALDNYQGVAFGVACQSLITFTYFDDFSLNGFTGEPALEIDDIIVQVGDCISNVVLSINSVPGFDIQWYHEGIAVPGETFSSIIVPPGQEGIYTVMLHNGSECGVYEPIDVQIDEQVLEIAGIVSDVDCFGAEDGSIDLILPTQNNPLFIDWDNGENQQIISDLAPGTYTVTVTDLNGCFNIQSFEIDSPPDEVSGELLFVGQPTGTMTFGTATVNATGGTAPYSFLWSNGESTPTATNLSPGLNTVTITDDNGCETIIEVMIFEPLVVAMNFTEDFCGTCSGTIVVEVFGGMEDYEIEWNFDSEEFLLTGLCAMEYSFTVTDAFGTQFTGSQTISSTAPMSLETTLLDEMICYGYQEGFIMTNVQGGTGPYEYIWSNDSITSTIVNLGPDSYSLTVTDQNNCTVVAEYIIEELPEIIIEGNVQQPECNGGENGGVELSISGGLAPFEFEWSNGSTNQNLANLAIGNYSVTVSDSLGCTAIADFTLSGNEDFQVLPTIINSSCQLANDGSVMLVVEGVDNPLFMWENGSTDSSLQELSSGTYNVVVSDGNGCEIDLELEVLFDEIFEIESEYTELICNGTSDGVIELNGSDLDEYIYQWSNGSSEQNITNLEAGNYIVTITDEAGCVVIDSMTIEDSEAIYFEDNISNATCIDGSNGSISIDVSGGFGNIQFQWDNNESVADITNLSVGEYTLTATDELGCQHIESFEIVGTSDMNLESEIQNAGCDNEAIGAIELTVQGGVEPYTFNWSNGNSSPSISNLTSGIYTVEIIDELDCSLVDSFEILDNGSLEVSVSFENPNCFDSNNGSITVDQINGEGPFQISLNDQPASDENMGLSEGWYDIEITDNNDCSYEESIFITAPQPIKGSVLSTTHIGPNIFGSATIEIIGGVEPYTIEWTNGEVGLTANMLTQGNHTVTVIDSNDCSLILEVFIEGPDLVLDTRTTNNICFQECNGVAEVQIMESVGDLEIEWDNGETTPSIQNLCNGIYFATVEDAFGNSEVLEFTISSNEAIEVSSVSSGISCIDREDGSISLEISGGVGPFQVFHEGALFDGNNLPSGTYSLTVQDANGCTFGISETIEDFNLPKLEITKTDPDCFGGGEIEVLYEEGSDFIINLVQSNEKIPFVSNLISDLAAGSYSVELENDEDCLVQLEEVELSEFPLEYGESDVMYFNITEGESLELKISELPFEENYLVSWLLDPEFECSIMDLFTNCLSISLKPSYSTKAVAVVENEFGCRQEFHFEITVEEESNIYAPNIISGNSDKSFKLVAQNENTMIETFTIFSRWGERLYNEENTLINTMKGWDLLYNNKKVSQGVYVYLARYRYPDGSMGAIAGDVTVIR